MFSLLINHCLQRDISGVFSKIEFFTKFFMHIRMKNQFLLGSTSREAVSMQLKEKKQEA